MKNVWITALLVALSLACSGTDKDPVDVTTDNVIDQDVAADDVLDGDTVVPSDIPEADVAGDQTVEPQSPYSDEMLDNLCSSYCDPDNDCEGVAYETECVADCIVLATADESLAKKLACAHGDDEEKEYCERYDGCAGDWEYNETCVALCDDVEACDALGTELFGQNLQDCALVCSGSVGLNPAGEQILACIDTALETCSGIEFFSCIEPPDDTVCEEGLCGADVDPTCSPVPDPFATPEECVESCTDWTAGQGIAAQVCLERAYDLPVDCAGTFLNCVDVPEAPAEGALEYCEVFHGKCGSLGEGDAIDLLGALGRDVCAWQMTGFITTKPEAFQTFPEAVTCLEELEFCPSGDLSSFYCLFDITAEHIAICAPVADLCTDPIVAAEVTLACEAALGYAAGFIPDAVETIEDYVTNAADCESLSVYFFGDEE